MVDKTTIEGELRVKEILKERGIKMKDLAEQIHIAPETLTRALKGNPQYSTLKSIADFLGISVRELFKDNFVLRARICVVVFSIKAKCLHLITVQK